MYKVKLFFGSIGDGYEPADIEFNNWLSNNPHIEIIDIKYQQSGYGDHSICIFYKEFI